MYNLQEAYLGVYYDLDEAEKLFPYGKVGDKLRSLHIQRQKAKTPEEENKIAKRQKKINKEYNVPMEQADLYDLIFDYLLDEGYADTEEAATVIMANMSEDWRQSICEAEIEPPREKVGALINIDIPEAEREAARKRTLEKAKRMREKKD